MRPKATITGLAGRRGAVFDTNMLLVLAVGACGPRAIRSFKRISNYGEQTARFAAHVARQLPVWVTPHILAEFSNLSIDRLSAGPYTDLLLDALRRAHELHIAKDLLLDEHAESVRRFGIADAGIEVLARTMKLMTFTDDRRLAGWIAHRGGAVITPGDGPRFGFPAC